MTGRNHQENEFNHLLLGVSGFSVLLVLKIVVEPSRVKAVFWTVSLLEARGEMSIVDILKCGKI
jgi:hypothetical protein